MKKILILLLASLLALTLVACDDNEATSSTAGTSTTSTTSVAESKEESEEVSTEVSEEESEEEIIEPDEETLDTGIIGPGKTLNRNTTYTYLAENDGHVTGYDASAIRFNRWNGEAQIGDTLLLTGTGGSKLVEACTGDNADLTDFAVIIVTYDMAAYRYTVTAVSAAGEDKAALVFPNDGFAIAVSEVAGTEAEALKTSSFKLVNQTNVTNVSKYTVGQRVEIDGISALQLNWEIKSTTNAPTLDGRITAGEYGSAVLEFDGSSPEVDYRGFDAADKYATGAFYATYDAEYLYLAWSIASEIHSNSIPLGSEGSIWQYDCAQIVISTMNPNNSVNLDNALAWNGSPGGTGTKAYEWTVEIGIAVNDDGDTLLCKNWFSNNMNFEGKALRDDDSATTVYEVKIALADLNTECPGYETSFESGTQIGVSFSINTNDGTTRVVRLRDGGGVYGSNDFSKIPTITLG